MINHEQKCEAYLIQSWSGIQKPSHQEILQRTFHISAKKWCTDTPHGQAKRPFHTMFTLTPRPFALLSSHIAFTNPQRTWRHWSLLVQIVRFTCPRRRTFSNATFASLQKGASCWRLISASRHSRCECLSNQHVFV